MVFASVARRHILGGIYTMDVSESNIWIQTARISKRTNLTNMSHFFIFKIPTRYQLLDEFKIRILTLYSSLFFKIRSSVSITYLSNITTRHREAPNYSFEQILVSSKHCLIHNITSHSQLWYDVQWWSIESVTK